MLSILSPLDHPHSTVECQERLSRQVRIPAATRYSHHIRIWGCEFYSRESRPLIGLVYTGLSAGRSFELGISILLMSVRSMRGPAISYVRAK